jgi:hypothetical protein
MRSRLPFLIGGLALAMMQLALRKAEPELAQNRRGRKRVLNPEHRKRQSDALYIIGPGQVLKRDVQLGEPTSFPAGSLYNAGRYLAVLHGAPHRERLIRCCARKEPCGLSFLAKPSRLPVGLHDGITGAVYVFDAYHNLIVAPRPVSFELSTPSGTVQKRTVVTHDGAAWTAMDSTAQQGIDRFVARIGDVSSTRRKAGSGRSVRIEDERPAVGPAARIGNRSGPRLQRQRGAGRNHCHLHRDLSRRSVNGRRTPQARNCRSEMPVHMRSNHLVASGVVMGNQIGWEK